MTGASPVAVQIWQGRAHSRRCGTGARLRGSGPAAKRQRERASATKLQIARNMPRAWHAVCTWCLRRCRAHGPERQRKARRRRRARARSQSAARRAAGKRTRGKKTGDRSCRQTLSRPRPSAAGRRVHEHGSPSLGSPQTMIGYKLVHSREILIRHFIFHFSDNLFISKQTFFFRQFVHKQQPMGVSHGVLPLCFPGLIHLEF